MNSQVSYRVQLTPQFKLSHLKHMIPYLSAMGIHKLYASPILKARSGSQHGYDVVDPSLLNPELGTEEELTEVFNLIHSKGMIWLQDIVPNHMAYSNQNKILVDVLEWGKESSYSDFFDIEWDSYYPSLKGRVLAPFLGRSYNECLESGELKLIFNENGFQARYYDLYLPVNPDGYVSLLRLLLSFNKDESYALKPSVATLVGYSTALNDILKQPDFGVKWEWFRNLKFHLWNLYQKDPEIQSDIDQVIAYCNGKNTLPDPLDPLDQLLNSQHYRLSFWKVATEEINYRRFFTVNELITMNIDKDKVFHFLHFKIFEWISKGHISELRIDHIDGLYDPATYLERLQKKVPGTMIYVEKILEYGEHLPKNWKIAGTTGYDFLGMMNGLFFTTRSYRLFMQYYQKITHHSKSIEDVGAEKKRLILGKHMASNIEELAHLLMNITFFNRVNRDMTLYSLKRAIVEVLVYFPVYRTYQTVKDFSTADKVYVQEAVLKAMEKNPGMVSELTFIESVFLKKSDEMVDRRQKEIMAHFIMRFQQFSSPLMAKGIEDTLYYNYNFFIGLNEVGGYIHHPVTPKKFHQWMKQRHAKYPNTMNTTATHDTKRGEDFRARLLALTEFFTEWTEVTRYWFKVNAKYRDNYKLGLAPDRNDEYFFYQTLVGSHPFVPAHTEDDSYLERLNDYTIKSIREAKNYTSWIKPDHVYEEKFKRFITHLWELPSESLFKKSLIPFVARIQDAGLLYALSQLLLKMTCPGVPDIYQGNELWDFHFVDPDNRQQVDYVLREQYLREIQKSIRDSTLTIQGQLWEDRYSGKLKLYYLYQLIKLREIHAELFKASQYVAVPYDDKNEAVFSFILKGTDVSLWVVVPLQWRHYIEKNRASNIDFKKFRLPPHESTIWECYFSGEVLSIPKMTAFSANSDMLPLGVYLSR